MNLIIESYTDFISRITNFNGRSTRMQFFSIMIIVVIISGVLSFYQQITDVSTLFKVSDFIISLVLGLATLSLTFRRFHDIGLSGKVYVILFIASYLPILNMFAPVITLIIALQPSKIQNNPESLWWKYPNK
jgi:uncharacterized membrane protein YhaH (DUF805 family)